MLLDETGSVLVSSTTVQKKNPWGLRAGLAVAAAAVAGAGVLAVTSALSEPAGPQSPEEAVTQLFEALGNEDALGMAEVLLPSERESLIEPGLAVFAELQRLGVLDQQADLSQVSYIDIRIEGLELTTTPVADGLVLVAPTGGTIAASGSGEVPWGERFGGRGEAWSEAPVPMDDESVKIAVVEEDGSWYVSLYYSIGEAARQDLEGAAAPVLGGGPAPVGAESPEAAVRAVFDNFVALDPEGVLTMLDPEEARALYDYSYLFMDRLDAATEGFREETQADGLSWELADLGVSSAEVGGRMVATVDSMSFRVVQDGEETLSVDLADDCVTTTTEGTTESFCAGDTDMEGVWGNALGSELWNSSVTVVERDGRWYVSSVPTTLYQVRDFLAGLQPDEFDELVASVESGIADPFSLMGMGMGTVTGMGSDDQFTEVEDAIEDTGEATIGDEETFEELAMDPAVIPPGSDGWGTDPSFSMLTGFGTDVSAALGTDVMDDTGAYVSVVTMPNADHIAVAVTGAEQQWGYPLMDPASVPAGLPPGTQVLDMGDGHAMILYQQYALTVFTAEDVALAVRILAHVSAGG